MIDVHCHLNFKAFDQDVDEVIQKATQAGVTTIINTGTKLDTSQKAVELAQHYPNLYAIVGVHPHHADKIELGSDWLEKLEVIARQPKVVGIGEIGMDYFRYQSNGIVDTKTQEEVFEAQIALAHKLTLPLQIHNRHAGIDTVAILKKHRNKLQALPGMFHCMSGDIALLTQVLELGFFVGFDGNSTYPGIAKGETTALSELIAYAPLERIVIETDSPYLTPQPHRGQRNQPQYAILTGEFIAKIKAVPYSTVDEQTTKNATQLFNLP